MREMAEASVGRGTRTASGDAGRTIRPGPFALWATMLVVAVAAEGFIFADRSTWSSPSDAAGIGTIFALTYGVAGMLIVSRQPGNTVGRIFLYLTAVMAITEFCGEYAIYAYLPGHTALPLREAVAWISQFGFFLAFPVGATLLFLFFPDGLDGGRKWRAVLVVAVIGAATLAFGFIAQGGALTPSNRGNGNYFIAGTTNPTGFLGNGDTGTASVVQAIGWGLSGLALVFSVVATLLRLRRSSGERRQQLKWLAYFAAPVAPAFAIHFALNAANVQFPDIFKPIYILVFALGIPVATGIAILKYGLYEIDVFINRTLVYGALGAFITAVYVAIVVGIGALIGAGGKPNLALSIVATAVVAVAFQPVRERIQKLANRLVYGKRATPYEVLSQFSERVSESYATDDVLPRMARVLAEGTGAELSGVWLRTGPMLQRAASWPEDAGKVEPTRISGEAVPAMLDAGRAVEVRHQGELLGALTVRKRQGESMTPIEESLLDDLAHQAGLVLKNVGLTAELMQRLEDLRASRQRLVAAQDEERRRLERNLHDGAQQNLVALKVKLGLAEMFVDKDPARAQRTLEELKGDADEALETLRDLARGIYPPLLADQGLVPALESQARKATLPVDVVAEGIGRYPQDVEAAVYFCCLEALQNVQKYARATSAAITLAATAGSLTFAISDDGAGFDPQAVARGAGLQNMADRLDALGGKVDLESAPGAGTTLRGRLPIDASEAVVPEAVA
jgi:signal transduction histidine kinase